MGTPMGQHYCLRWNNYQSNMTSVFHQLLQDEAFVDVTLACNDASIKAHKVVLSACSPYFQQLLLDNPCKHPVIILPQEVNFLDLQFIIEFVYRGEIDVSHTELHSLLRTAEQLKIKGLCEVAAREMGVEPRRHPKVKFSTFSNKRNHSSMHSRSVIEQYDYQHNGMMLMKAEISPCPEMGVSYEDEIVDVEEPKNLSRDKEITDVNANSTSHPTLQESHAGSPHDRLGVKVENHDNSNAGANHHDRSCESDQAMMVTPELLGLIPTSSLHSDASCDVPMHKTTKHWSQEDMDLALEALRSQSMNLTKASATFGIPSTTLWQRAHRLGINTPKKDSAAKTWSESDLNLALDELRAGRISANRASKTYHIPSSTLYKIARKEGIKLSAPFNASPTTWNNDDLNRALDAIRSGASVQKAASEFGIPSGTLYGRCKREGIELCKNTPVPWSHNDMTDALESVRSGEMSINQAAIHFNLPYSSLYGRFKRVKYEASDSKLDFEMFSCDASEPGAN